MYRNPKLDKIIEEHCLWMFENFWRDIFGLYFIPLQDPPGPYDRF